MTKKAKPTRGAFLHAYRTLLQQNMMWAQDTARLDKFMDAVLATLEGKQAVTQWVWNGSLTTRAYNSIGGRGKPSLQKLQALT